MLNGRFDRRQAMPLGGMGQVWLAVDTVLADRTVALKMLRPEFAQDPGHVERFRREAYAMARISHPNVIDIYDVYTSDEGPFIVMEYVDGGSLSQALSRRGRLGSDETMRMVAQAADALAAAHRAGVVHRDIKPGNLLIRGTDESVVLTDFGIAQSPNAHVLTRAGDLIGTPTYMAPEVLRGAGSSPLSDVYSLGVVAYECLAGHPPFRAGNAIAVARMHLDTPPPPLPPDVAPAVRALVEQALAKQPGQRQQSAADLARQAREAITAAPATAASRPDPPSVVDAVRPTPATPPAGPDPRRRPRRLLPVLALLTAGVLAVAGAAYGYAQREDDAPAGPTMPADLRAFAPNWDHGSCVKDSQTADVQAERWHCDLDAETQLYLIRYKNAAGRDERHTGNARLEAGSAAGGLDHRYGEARAPGGTVGRYLEFPVNLATSGPADWHESIWFDNGPADSGTPFALLLRTRATPDAAQALDRLRRRWDDAGYTRPTDG